MSETPMFLTTGAGGGVGGVSRLVAEGLLARGQRVRATVHRDDERAEALRALGAEVLVGDLTDPVHVTAALDGVSRMFFSMSVSPDYLEATAVVCAAARERPGLEVLVNMSQMTVSQMTATSTEESRQQRLHWLAEHVIDWSAVPRVHIRPTVFLDNPLFTLLAAGPIRDRGVLALPFGSGRTSPIASSDVAEVVMAVLLAPHDHVGSVYELTGPTALDLDGLADQYARALGRPITAERLPHDQWADQLAGSALTPHVQQHIATMARLHREDRYNRSTTDVERITGRPPRTVEQYVRERRDLFDSHRDDGA
ncbi:NAD(P)H-binding protein [Streptomyces noursei]|uniref:NAD(P)H-binding protein n=1 Tax=Streptomyces noursei TaxID=1971 RepID=UPI001679DE42|nr:NAD(P)H-binding protein [Streptomyces noursei]MCZ1013195.1 NAD(P)H-binding protein [Streptomyces noursei]GGX27666.1 NmrA family transcriptional regulator [Streptomyces noursei]